MSHPALSTYHHRIPPDGPGGAADGLLRIRAQPGILPGGTHHDGAILIQSQDDFGIRTDEVGRESVHGPFRRREVGGIRFQVVIRQQGPLTLHIVHESL